MRPPLWIAAWLTAVAALIALIYGILTGQTQIAGYAAIIMALAKFCLLSVPTPCSRKSDSDSNTARPMYSSTHNIL
jgi:hypothetical protein